MAAVAELLAKVRAELAGQHASWRPLVELGEQGVLAELDLGWPGLEALLPRGALPGGVVELASVGAHPSTAFAVRAVRAAHARDAGAWCAWIDPERTLYAPGLLAGGVDLERLLVITPPRAQLGRVAVKLVSSGAFDVVAIDMDAVAFSGAAPGSPSRLSRARSRPLSSPQQRRREFPPEVLVRKLALAAEDGKTHVLLLTAAEKARVTSWPVGMRLDVARTPGGFAVNIAKERHGRRSQGMPMRAELPLLDHHVPASPPLAKTSAPVTPVIPFLRAHRERSTG